LILRQLQKGDPRIPFALLLTLYAAMGVLWLGFNRNPIQILITVASACLLDMLLHALLRKRELLLPLSAYITGLSLALILNYSHDYVLLLFPVFMAIGSKYVFTVKGAHAFNPSLFGVVSSLLLAGTFISTAPAYQWGGTWGISAFMVMAALSLFIFKVDRGWLVGSFLIFYLLQTALRAYLMRYWLPPEMLFLGSMSTPPFFLFTFFMITDPKTSPSSRRGQVAVAFAIAFLDLLLNLLQSVFTFYYAAFAVQAARFLWAHLRELRVAGLLAYTRGALGNRRFLRAAAVLTVLATSGDSLYIGVLRPAVTMHDAGFILREIPGSASGISVVMDPKTLDLIDPRVQRIAKWLMSVGSSVAVADVNNDGLPDLFLVTPLARAEDRYQLYLNRGGLHFERVPVPALDAIASNPKTFGFITGAVFFDYENDGDQDLLLPVSFGKTILLRNEFKETGTVAFEDVSKRAGVECAGLRSRWEPGHLARQCPRSVPAGLPDANAAGHPEPAAARVPR
jgi:Na+-translocating ferredoxin:NAD+ oxidoreductase RnfD subunit